MNAGRQEESRQNDISREKGGNLILDFSHVYPEDIEEQAKGLRRIDLSSISGTDMYCTEEAEAEIRRRLEPYGPCGIHFLDSGNYHYVTKFFTEMITEPFSLVMYDHHTDMQQPLFSQLTSCGSWAADVLRNNPFLEQLILAGPDQKSMEEIPADLSGNLNEKLICISREEIKEGKIDGKTSLVRMELPIYISIDKDVLDRSGARTNWNQGDMPTAVLEKLLLDVFRHQRVIGVDICGECSLTEPLPVLMSDREVNRETDELLYRFLSELHRKYE